MHIPFDEGLGIHPQDDFFLDREVWDLSRTPRELRPLLLHYHPLVIYRFQVLKQADVVLALFLQGDRFTAEEKRANFEYYDPITTGDSTLSAVVQSIMAAEVGYPDVAMDYFLQALYVDLKDLHGNTVDGLHVASTAGVWSTLVFGFAGMRDRGGRLSFDPRLPAAWPSMRFAIAWHDSRLRVELTQDHLAITLEQTGAAQVRLAVSGAEYVVTADSPLRVPLDGQGDRFEGLLGDKPILGGTRADGTKITAGVPEPIAFDELVANELEHYDLPRNGPHVAQT
jgi:alpha,alpha-trehalose phosphorylase